MSAPGEPASPTLARLLAQLPEAVRHSHAQHGDATAEVDAGQLPEVARLLRDDPTLAFEMLTDLCAVDHWPAAPRFELVYHFYSVAKGRRVRIKARIDAAAPTAPSLAGLYASAERMEREAFDLYGIGFEGHPDLRRILLEEDFVGHPLRKDFPKRGRPEGGAA